MRYFSPLLSLLLVAASSGMPTWAADPPDTESNASPGATERDEGAGYADPRDAVLLPERIAQRDYIREVSELLKARQFDELNAIYKELIESKARFATGDPKLAWYYYGVTSWQICPPNQRPLALFKLLRDWKELHPDVLAPKLAEAIVQHDYAWYARGGGFAHTVTPENAKRYEDRLVKTRELLLEAFDVQGQDPHLHVVEIDVARSSGSGVAKMREQLDKAVAIDPDYLPAYRSMAFSLLQRWYGAPGDLEAFLDEAVERTKEKWGQSLYALLAVYSNREGDQIFTNTDVEWRRMKAGFEDLRQRFPEVMLYPNLYSQYALYADDRETAARVFNEIGDRFDRQTWGAGVTFDRMRKIAIEGDTQPASQVLLPMTTYVYCLRFHPDTRELYTAIARRNLPGWDPTTGLLGKVIDTGKRMPYKFDFSSDGQTLAMASPDGEIIVRDLQSGEDIASVKPGSPLYDLRFAPDGSLVVGVRQANPVAYVFEVQAETLHEFPVADNVLTSVALSPDAKMLATGESKKRFRVWSVPDGRELTSVTDFTFVIGALAFSPDGRTLAVGHAKGKTRPPKGMISLYDTATWKKTADIFAAEVYVNSLCYSPDGTMLASGSYDGRVKLWDVD